MQPIFKVLADKKDITALLQDRLIHIKTTDRSGIENDICEISIDDRECKVEMPRRGAVLEIWLGYEGVGLSMIGSYTVDGVKYKGPPRTLTVTGKSASMRAQAKALRSAAWEGVALSSIVADIAKRNGWTPVCPMQVKVPRADQSNESDIHFLTRLALQFDATAKIANGRLLVLPRESGKTASGKKLPTVTLRESDLADYDFDFQDRAAVSGVDATYHDSKTGQPAKIYYPNQEAAAGGGAPKQSVRHVYPDAERAKAAAKAKVASANRNTCQVKLELSGRDDIVAESTVRIEGVKAGVDGDFLVDSVEHQFRTKGWTVTISSGGGKQGKAEKKGKKATKPAKVYTPGD